VCNKRFINHSALKLHFNIHTVDKPYKCATCQNPLTDRGYCMWHLMIQPGEKCFVCWSVGRHSVGRSVWRDTLDCTLHTATFPLSLWWQFHSEGWFKQTYWKTARSKIVICSIKVFWHVICYSIISRGVNPHFSNIACTTGAVGWKLFYFM